MTRMVSYAANREDVLLRRLFPQAQGFYIDVGAADPVAWSLTKHFYDRGWKGINVEPAAHHFERLKSERVRDVNLRAALSNRAGEEILYEFSAEYAGLDTLSLEQAEMHRKKGFLFKETLVSVTTLAEVCAEYTSGEIDFISIDVEGHELEVLEGGDWRRWRPRVAVIEATQPNTKIPTHQGWEPILLDADYLFAAFDGLNRYYVRAEDRDLIPLLSTPANILDEFEPYEYLNQLDLIRSSVGSAPALLEASRVLHQSSSGMVSALLAEFEEYKQKGEAEAAERGALLHNKVAGLEAQHAAAKGALDQIGPLGFAVGRRISSYSAKYPAVSGPAKSVVKAGLRFFRRLRRAVSAR